MESLITLPIDTLVVIAAGYLGYCLAYRGSRAKHKAVDTTLITLTFGMLCKVMIVLLSPYIADEIVVYSISMVGVLVLAGLWSQIGRGLWTGVLRKAGITASDDVYGVQDTVRASINKWAGTQLAVHLNDGTVLWCDDLKEFANQPHGPCLLGEDGSVGMYVTSIQLPGIEEEQKKSPIAEHAYWGAKFTILAASQIKRMDIRLAKIHPAEKSALFGRWWRRI